MIDWREFVEVDINICHGKACIKNTRIPVAVILDNLAAGQSASEILGNYPSLRSEDVFAALSYAAEIARERILPLQETA